MFISVTKRVNSDDLNEVVNSNQQVLLTYLLTYLLTALSWYL